MASESPGTDPTPRAHRLASARSTYLRGASEQAIDWYPWGPEPFEIARRTGRPVLLDIGAVWCHWCHVMDEGTYSDPEVARLLHQNFVAVKVDRDENPEVDRRYQRQVGALSGEGGWPLTAFLTADGAVFLGGTYFPPQDGMGRPGFRRVLKEVARLYREEPDRVAEAAKHVGHALERIGRPASVARPRAAFVESIDAEIEQLVDPVNGGFGHAPKFPHPIAVSFLLYRSVATGRPGPEERARETLRRMADGGVYDHVGGGFHRYSVDEAWHIPHFEKMGADNGPLLAAYVDGARRFGDDRFTDTIRGIVAWSAEVLGDPAGGFGASQDADNAPGDDGGYFTWSRPELKAALSADELRFATRLFGVGSDGRMPHDPDRNVLYRLMPPAEAAAGADRPGQEDTLYAGTLSTLRRVRGARPTPVIDRALYADLNGGFVRGLAGAGRYLGDPIPIALARRAADRFLTGAYDRDRGVAHRLDPSGPTGWGHLEDQAHFALGLIELAGATLEPSYVAAAESILQVIDRRFRGEGGLLRDLSPELYDGPKVGGLATPSYPLEDSPHLSGNAAAALAGIRFSSLTGTDGWLEFSASIAEAASARLAGAGLFGAGTALAAGLLDLPSARIVVTGTGAPADALVRAAERSYHPNAWVFRGSPPPPFSLPSELVDASATDGPARALVCFGTRCLAPITEPAKIPALLRSGGSAAA